MIRTSRIALIFLAFLIFNSAVTAQSEVSEEKRKLISEIVKVFKMDQQMAQITDGILKEFQNTYPLSYSAAIDARNDITPSQKAKLKASVGDSFRVFSEKFRKRLAEKVDFAKYVNDVMYPLYDEFYSEQELKDVLAFYGSPTGQKIVETLPKLFEASQKAAREKFLPQILPIITELIEEEFPKSDPPKPVKRQVN